MRRIKIKIEQEEKKKKKTNWNSPNGKQKAKKSHPCIHITPGSKRFILICVCLWYIWLHGILQHFLLLKEHYSDDSSGMKVKAEEARTSLLSHLHLTSSLACLKVATSNQAQKVLRKSISLPVFPRWGMVSEENVSRSLLYMPLVE